MGSRGICWRGTWSPEGARQPVTSESLRLSSSLSHPARRERDECTEAAAVLPPSETDARNAARALAEGAYKLVSRMPGSRELFLKRDQRDQARIGGAACPGSGAPSDRCQLDMKVVFGNCSWSRNSDSHPEYSPAFTAMAKRM